MTDLSSPVPSSKICLLGRTNKSALISSNGFKSVWYVLSCLKSQEENPTSAHEWKGFRKTDLN